MAIPDTAQGFVYEMDSRDSLDFYVPISRGPLLGDVLTEDEDVRSFTIDVGTEAMQAGLYIIENPGRQPIIQNRVIGLHAAILPSQQNHARFLGPGMRLPINIFLETNFTRLRQKQQTIFMIVRDK